MRKRRQEHVCSAPHSRRESGQLAHPEFPEPFRSHTPAPTTTSWAARSPPTSVVRLGATSILQVPDRGQGFRTEAAVLIVRMDRTFCSRKVLSSYQQVSCVGMQRAAVRDGFDHQAGTSPRRIYERWGYSPWLQAFSPFLLSSAVTPLPAGPDHQPLQVIITLHPSWA